MSETVVVVGYDGREHSERALERGIDIVREVGGKVIVIVAEPVSPAGYGSPFGSELYDSGFAAFAPESTFPDLEDPLPGAQDIIDRAKKRLNAAGVEAECTWAIGDPAQVIVDAAREYDASKIVIGEHHHGFFVRLFAGDVDAEVKRLAECEVILVE